MARTFLIGDKVTVGPPYDNLPIILSMQRHARVSGRPIQGDGGVYVQVELDGASPENRYHMIPLEQVLPGWVDVRLL